VITLKTVGVPGLHKNFQNSMRAVSKTLQMILN